MCKRLKIALIEKRMTQRELARRVGIGESLLSYYITGGKQMPESIKGKIARTLRIRKDELFEG
jgi:transcriptional regulator with XRE-family HTH domain